MTAVYAGKSEQQRFIMSSISAGSAAQLAAAHCPNERTMGPQSAAIQTHLLLYMGQLNCDSYIHPNFGDYGPTAFSIPP